MKNKFGDIITITAFDLGMDDTVVNNIVRFHYNKAFELYNTLDYWTIYLENFGTLWATVERIDRYIERLNSIKAKLVNNQQLRYYSQEDIPKINDWLEKLDNMRESALKDRMDKKEATKKHKLKRKQLENEV